MPATIRTSSAYRSQVTFTSLSMFGSSSNIESPLMFRSQWWSGGILAHSRRNDATALASLAVHPPMRRSARLEAVHTALADADARGCGAEGEDKGEGGDEGGGATWLSDTASSPESDWLFGAELAAADQWEVSPAPAPAA